MNEEIHNKLEIIIKSQGVFLLRFIWLRWFFDPKKSRGIFHQPGVTPTVTLARFPELSMNERFIRFPGLKEHSNYRRLSDYTSITLSLTAINTRNWIVPETFEMIRFVAETEMINGHVSTNRVR